MLLCGIINELEKDSGVMSCFFCQASINSATAVLRGLIYILVDRQRFFSRIKQLFEDVNAWVAVRDIFMDITDQSAKPGQWTIPIRAETVSHRSGPLTHRVHRN